MSLDFFKITVKCFIIFMIMITIQGGKKMIKLLGHKLNNGEIIFLIK